MAENTRLDADEDPLIGQVLAETYRITRLIGEGGMGQVFEATHVRHKEKRFAVKLLIPDGMEDPVFQARFRREAEIASLLSHPNIVEVVEFNFTSDGRPYLAMELLKGEDLEERLARHRSLPPSEVLEIMKQVGSAVQAAHDVGIVHRDLKPANVFVLAAADKKLHVKVLDFGVSKILGGASRITATGNIVGTLLYLAPEQYTARPDEIDHRVDIFALGLITYECLCGKRPFPGTTPAALFNQICNREPVPLSRRVPGLPTELDAVLARAMAKDKAKRYARVSDFVEALRQALSDVNRLLLVLGHEEQCAEERTIEEKAKALGSTEEREAGELDGIATQHMSRSALQRLALSIVRVPRPRWRRRLAFAVVGIVFMAIGALICLTVALPPTRVTRSGLAFEQHDARAALARADAALPERRNAEARDHRSEAEHAPAPPVHQPAPEEKQRDDDH